MDFPDETEALTEARLLRDYFSLIPITKNNFGLIHFDFEYDNVFYDQASQSCNVIDFDDAMYHWYAMDFEQALHSLQDDIPREQFSHKKQCFLDGYVTEYEITDDIDALMPACRRFAQLYGYVRVLRSAAEKWSNEPDWLLNLREKLTEYMAEDASSFGKKL